MAVSGSSSECSEALSETEPLLPSYISQIETNVYKSRFWVLAVTSVFSCIACWQWNTWGPISESVMAAYPEWDSGTIALMVNLGTGVFIISVFPVCWMLDSLSLRQSMIITCLLTTFALVIRCFTSDHYVFTLLSYISAALLGVPLTVILVVPPLIAVNWFPQQERATAQAIMFALEQFGLFISYLEPLYVPMPSDTVSNTIIERQVTYLMYIGAGVSFAILLTVLIYYPSMPPSPPSNSACTVRMSLKSGIASFLKKRDLCVMLLCYFACTGPAFAWITLLDFSLLPLGIHQRESMVIGGIAVLTSVVATLAVGKYVDHKQGSLRSTLIGLLLLSAGFFYWFLLISEGVIASQRWQIYTSVVVGISMHYACLPVLYELTAELAYPSPEVVTGGVLALADNISASAFLLLYQLRIGVSWVPYVLVFSCALVVPPLLFIKVSYARTELDNLDQEDLTPDTMAQHNFITNIITNDEEEDSTNGEDGPIIKRDALEPVMSPPPSEGVKSLSSLYGSL